MARDRRVEEQRGRNGALGERLRRAHERVVIDEDAVRPRAAAIALHLQLLERGVHDDVPHRVGGPAVRRLVAERCERVREAVPQAADVPLRVIELEPVVVGREHLVAVEVERARARLEVLHRVPEAHDLVVADDVAVALDGDPVVVGVRTAVVEVDVRPDEPPFEDVVAEVEVLLILARAEAETGVLRVDAADDVAHRARGLEAERAIGVAERQPLDVHVAAVDLEHVAARAVAAVEHGAVHRRAAQHDRIRRGAARVEDEGSRIDAVGERDHVARCGGREGRVQPGRVAHGDRVRRRRITGNGARRAAEHDCLIDGTVGVGRVQLDVVRRRRPEVEDAARELLGDEPPDDRFGTDTEERRRRVPDGIAGDAVADGNRRVMVVVARDRQLHAEGHERRPVEARGPRVEDIVGARIDARVVGIEAGEPPRRERVLRRRIEARRARAGRGETRAPRVELRERRRLASLLVKWRVGESEATVGRLHVAMQRIFHERREVLPDVIGAGERAGRRRHGARVLAARVERDAGGRVAVQVGVVRVERIGVPGIG